MACVPAISPKQRTAAFLYPKPWNNRVTDPYSKRRNTITAQSGGVAGLLDFYRFESDKAPASSNGRVGLVSGIDLRIGLVREAETFFCSGRCHQ